MRLKMGNTNVKVVNFTLYDASVQRLQGSMKQDILFRYDRLTVPSLSFFPS